MELIFTTRQNGYLKGEHKIIEVYKDDNGMVFNTAFMDVLGNYHLVSTIRINTDDSVELAKTLLDTSI